MNFSESSKPRVTALKIVIPVVIGIVFVVAIIVVLSLVLKRQSLPARETTFQNIKQFQSVHDLQDFIKQNRLKGRGEGSFIDSVGQSKTTNVAMETSSDSGAQDFSTTNIQVEGVDEADIIKNDDQYIYAVSNKTVFIIDAYPPENMEILSEISVAGDSETQYYGNAIDLYISGDRLIVITSGYSEVYYEQSESLRCEVFGECPPSYQEVRTVVHVYDVSDRRNPELQDEIQVSGNYAHSRMIGDYVYIIANQYIYDDITLPVVVENGDEKTVNAEDIYYDETMHDDNFQFTNIAAINITNGKTTQEVSVTGHSNTLYVSKNNIFLTRPQYHPWYREYVGDEEENREKTIIHKISIDKERIEYTATGEVPGHLLNQFSMDEFDNHLRVATTVGEIWRNDGSTQSKNNVYILDNDLEVVGELEGLAPGEKIYSVRFMGERGYIVTFKKVDPLFVIDLSNPKDPEVLGKLKIPGYSDYLHPYDEYHIIGIGKETVEASEELTQSRNLDFAWYQGVKMAIFDVRDVHNPKELHKVVIGDRGTSSEALYDHKAFLFDKEKELLVIPITLVEIQGEKTKDNQYGEQTFQGAYVYRATLENGFDLTGRVTHHTEEDELKRGDYYGFQKKIRRSLFMDDFLYTYSGEMIKVHDLWGANEIHSVGL